jgi:hypothetical protein
VTPLFRIEERMRHIAAFAPLLAVACASPSPQNAGKAPDGAQANEQAGERVKDRPPEPVIQPDPGRVPPPDIDPPQPAPSDHVEPPDARER